MSTITYFHRNLKAGYSINKVTQTIISEIHDKEEFYVPESRASLKAVVRNLLFVYRHRNKTGINHITGDIHYCILALLGCKSVLTIHDTVSLDFAKSSKLKRIIIRFLWFYLPLKLATKVICISEATKYSIQKIVNRNDIQVIYDSVDPNLKPYPIMHDTICPNILIIGTNENKNLYRMMQAVSGLNLTITIVGHLTDALQQHIIDLKLRCINVYDLSDLEIIDQYINCNIVLFCSLYEGFGMPLIEANAVGRPVITSNIPVLKEVGSNAALYVDPYSVESIRSGLKTVMADEILRNKLISNGFINAKRFEQGQILRQWICLYNRILS